jgi:hypothetical protein
MLMKQHLAPYYNDPLRDRLSEIEDSVEHGLSTQPATPFRDDAATDPLCEQLGALEQSIEGVTASPPPPPPELPVAPMLPSPAFGGPQSPDPPALAEPRERDWPALMAPAAAKPFFAHEGLDSRGYHPQASRSTGARATTSEPVRWCPDTAEHIAENKCLFCPNWADHGSGFPECFFDWRRENENKEEEEPEPEE